MLFQYVHFSGVIKKRIVEGPIAYTMTVRFCCFIPLKITRCSMSRKYRTFSKRSSTFYFWMMRILSLYFSFSIYVSGIISFSFLYWEDFWGFVCLYKKYILLFCLCQFDRSTVLLFVILLGIIFSLSRKVWYVEPLFIQGSNILVTALLVYITFLFKKLMPSINFK